MQELTSSISNFGINFECDQDLTSINDGVAEKHLNMTMEGFTCIDPVCTVYML